MINSLTLSIKKVLKASATTWLLILSSVLLLPSLTGCSTTEVKYVEKVVYVKSPYVPQLMDECLISLRDGNRVRDYITSERRLRNDLVICNLMIKERNEYESLVDKDKE